MPTTVFLLKEIQINFEKTQKRAINMIALFIYIYR